ncbi:AHH domain-containing protein, partial [Acetivibrio ethanolgignens]|uniref:AHH domain-containing protein n=1 Tax=Acetivibrio ethanolgignens TaxID=290052 RepID=UPI000AEC7984
SKPVSRVAPSRTSSKSSSSAKASKSSTASKSGKAKVSKSDSSTKAPKTTTVKMADALSSKKSLNTKSSQKVVNIGEKKYNVSIEASIKAVAGGMVAGVGSTIRIGAAAAAGEAKKAGTEVKTGNGKVSTVPQNINLPIAVSRTFEIMEEAVPKAANTATATVKIGEILKARAVSGVTLAVKNKKPSVVTKDTKSSAVITRDTKEDASKIKESINVGLAVSNIDKTIKAGAVFVASEMAAKTAGTVVLRNKKQGVQSGYQKRNNSKKEKLEIKRNQKNEGFGIGFGPLFSPGITIGKTAIGLPGIPGLIGKRTPSNTKNTIPGGTGGSRAGYYMLHPPGERKAYKVTNDDVHALMDGLAMIPVLGDAADVLDAAIYLSEGKVGKAAEKLFWVVIGLDEISDARKILGYMNKAVEKVGKRGNFGDGIKVVRNMLKKKFGKEVLEETTEEAVETGIKSGRKIGIKSGSKAGIKSGTTTKPNQVHHYATNKSKTYTPQLEEIANRYGLDLDDAWNKDLLPHQGRHPNAYHEYVLDSMKQFDNIAQGDKDIFLKLFDNLKNNVKSNPDMLYKDYWK